MYEVGQILFVISKKGNKVFPVQVIEKTIKKTLKGETCTHSIMLPNGNETVAVLEDIDVDVFSTHNEAYESMMRNAQSAIQQMIQRAKEVASSYFNRNHVEDTNDDNDYGMGESPSAVEDAQYVVLEDGRKARIKMPSLE
jgi:hypothetical protein